MRTRKGRKKQHASPSASSAAAAAESIPSVMAVSTLDIVNVTASDAGIYTCAPANAKNHSVVVHVVKGKRRLFCPQVAGLNRTASCSGWLGTSCLVNYLLF